MIVPSQNPVLCRFPDHERHPVGKVLLATSPTSDAFSGEEIAFGLCVPPHTPHALCSSMPTWKDNVAFMEREKWAMDAMKVGYPRFIVHESVGKVCISQDLSIQITDGTIFSSLSYVSNVSAPLENVAICFLL